MFRNNMFASTPTLKLFLGLGLCTLGGAMMYVYFKNRDEEDGTTSDETQRPQKSVNGKKKKTPVVKTVKLDVPNDQVPQLMGRGASNINVIEAQTNTKIQFRDKNDSHKTCEITGYIGDVQYARELLLRLLDTKIQTEQMMIPSDAMKKVIGPYGATLTEICRTTKAKVAVDNSNFVSGTERRIMTIIGSQKQIDAAKQLIEEKIAEDAAERKAIEETEQQREPRRSPSNSVSSSIYSSQTSLSSHIAPREKLLAAKSDERSMEVYVSAVAAPSKFWVQLVGPQTKKLDDLVRAMSEYYDVEENRKFHQIKEPYVGQIVAAVFKYDGKWYRAEIVGILPNDYNANEVVLDLYFVDYGDSEYVQPQDIYELRTDFLTLRFQAVECFLANIRTTENNNDTWPMQSIQKFEELVHVAQWKKLTAKVVTYKERSKANLGDIQSTSVAREGSPIPGVELFDTVDGLEYNINYALVSQGYALPLEEIVPPVVSSSPASSPDMLMHGDDGSSHSPTPTNETNGGIQPQLMNTTEDAVMQEQSNHLNKKQSTTNTKSNRDQLKSLAAMNGVDISQL